MLLCHGLILTQLLLSPGFYELQWVLPALRLGSRGAHACHARGRLGCSAEACRLGGVRPAASLELELVLVGCLRLCEVLPLLRWFTRCRHVR